MSCAPHWYQEGLPCPHGEDFLYVTTWPRVDNDTPFYERLSMHINIFYSLLPLGYFVWSLTLLLYMLVISGSHRQTAAARRATLVNYRAYLKYIILSMLVLALVKVEKKLFHCRRPPMSCMHSCGVPDGMDVWAAALFMSRCIDLMFRWSVPHLTIALPGLDTTNEEGLPPYTKEEVRQLGYDPILTGEFLVRLVFLMAVLGPVPMARILLGDTEYMSVMFGVLEGLVVSVSFHVGYVKLFTSEKYGEWLHQVLERSILFSGFFRDGLMTRLREGGEGEDASDMCERLSQMIVRILNSVRQAFAAAKASSWELSAGSVREELAAEPRGERNSWLPGLEFLAIRTDRALELLEAQRDEKIAQIFEAEQRLQTMEQAMEEKQQEIARMEASLAEKEAQVDALEGVRLKQQEDLERIQNEREEALASTRKAMESTLNWSWPAGVEGTLVPVTDPTLLDQLQALLRVRHKTTDNWTRDRGCTLHGRGSSECSLKCANNHRVTVPTGYVLRKAFRNQNMDLWESFTKSRDRIIQECADGADCPYADVAEDNKVPLDKQFLKTKCNEWRLFHGTKIDACRSICQKNFLLTFVGKGATWPGAAGPLYGRGVYLAEKITKADEYADPAPASDEFAGFSCVLVVRCVGGRVNVVRTNEVDQDDLMDAVFHGPYNSVFGERTKITPHPKPYNEFVVYDQNQLYPEFLLIYERQY